MRIAVDIDEVLCRTNDSFFEFFNKEHNTKFSREDILDYNYSSLEGFNEEYVFTSVVKFVHENVENFHIVPESIEILKKLKSEGHKLFILTSRWENLYDRTKKWLDVSFGENFFENIFFTGGVVHAKKCKSDVCIKEKFDLLIEDAPKYAINTSQKKILVLLMDCPWNRSLIENKYLVRVKNWNEIYEKIRKYK